MASGKSLELRQIKKPSPEPICICGDDFSEHLEYENGVPKMKEKYNDGHQHYQAGISGGTLRRSDLRSTL